MRRYYIPFFAAALLLLACTDEGRPVLAPLPDKNISAAAPGPTPEPHLFSEKMSLTEAPNDTAWYFGYWRAGADSTFVERIKAGDLENRAKAMDKIGIELAQFEFVGPDCICIWRLKKSDFSGFLMDTDPERFVRRCNQSGHCVDALALSDNGGMWALLKKSAAPQCSVVWGRDWNLFTEQVSKVHSGNQCWLSEIEVGPVQPPGQKRVHDAYFGLFRSGNGGFIWYLLNDWQDVYTALVNPLAPRGYALQDLEVFRSDAGRPRYLSIYLFGEGEFYTWHAHGWANFLRKMEALKGTGLHLVEVEVY